MKKSVRLLAVLLLASVTMLVAKDTDISPLDLPVIPGGVSRPYEVICEVTNVQAAPLKFAAGTGATGSFYSAARDGMNVIRAYAKKQGADAVIDLKTEFVVFNQAIYEQNAYTGGAMGCVYLHGTMIKYTDKKK